MSSKDVFEEYLEVRYNPNTVRQYLWAYNSFAQRYKLSQQEGVNNFIKDKVFNAEHPNNPFYKGFLKALIDCFNLKVEIPKSKRKNPKIIKDYKFLTKEQINTIINGSNEWVSLLVRIYFETGLRLRELIDTKLEDINLNERTISGIGKGNKPFEVKFSQRSKNLLEKWLENNKRENPFYYSNENKNYARSFQYYLKQQCEMLGIEKVTPHKIRHALGHHLRADLNFDLMQVKEVLRHSNLETTEIYAKATKEEVERKMKEEVFKE